MKAQKTVAIPTVAILMALALLAGSASADEHKSLTTENSGQQALPDTSGWEVVHRGTIKKVTVTNTVTGEQGCHNRETQKSTPGACE